MRKYLIVLIFLVSNAFAQAMMTKVITLTYIDAQNVIQLMQPLLHPGEELNGTGQTLIAKVSPATLTQIRTVLHQIDVPPVTFTVSVYQGPSNWLSNQNDNSVSYSTQPQSEVVRSQSVQVMNGQSALISTSQQVPIVSAVGAGFFTGISYEQHDVTNGLMVQPVLKGSQVQLKVKRARQQIDAAGGQTFDNQELGTTVMAPLNKWISLGSAEGSQNTDSSSTSYTAGRSFSQNSTLYIKVSIVNGAGPGA